MRAGNIPFDIVPDLRLFPYETIEAVTKPPIRELTDLPSSLEQLLRLTSATTVDEIGEFGPSLASLAFETAEGNIPDYLDLYRAHFGRDSLYVAMELINSYPNLAKNTTLMFAGLQGLVYNTSREEEPGRIVHEVRNENDPIARDLTKRLGWGWPYYGSVDATPTFVQTLAAYCRQSPDHHDFLFHPYTDKAHARRMIADSLTFATDWILHRLDANPEGILEFKSALPNGIENQVWKDSWDAYHHSDGTLANHQQGIASIEVQVSAYDALLDAAELYESLDRHEEVTRLRARSEDLRQAILNFFWTDDKGGYFVLGTDRDQDGRLRQLKVRTSNMGHVLDSRLLEGSGREEIDKRTRVVRQLMSDEMLNISGIRTLASDEVLFRPGAYHNGSVWTFDTHKIARGMYRHGFTNEANQLDDCSLNVVRTTHAFPEYVRGDHKAVPSMNEYIIDINDHRAGRLNRLEQPPQEVQAWTVAAILAIKIRRGRDARQLLHLKQAG